MVSRAAGSVRHRSSTWEKRAISAGERPERSGGSRGRLNDCTWLTRTLRPPHAPGDEQPTTNRAAPRGRGPAVSSPHPVFAAAGLTDGERRGDRDGFADDPAGGARGSPGSVETVREGDHRLHRGGKVALVGVQDQLGVKRHLVGDAHARDGRPRLSPPGVDGGRGVPSTPTLLPHPADLDWAEELARG